eukprot:721363-Prymnesium_polylepis.1
MERRSVRRPALLTRYLFGGRLVFLGGISLRRLVLVPLASPLDAPRTGAKSPARTARWLRSLSPCSPPSDWWPPGRLLGG